MAARRYELTGFAWSIIEPLLANKPRGVPRPDDRQVLNGIDWRLRTGSPWADLPERYGPATTCYNRFVRWRKSGVWTASSRLFQRPMTAICRSWTAPRSASTSMAQLNRGASRKGPPLGTALTPDAGGARGAD